MAQPKVEPHWEAMAPEPNMLGEPFTCGPLSFPPGEWVPVTASMAMRLALYGWAQVRRKGDD